MADNRLVSLAERYGQLSNAHDLGAIAEMVSEEATDIYGHAGKEKAIEGMRKFRQTYANVAWEFGEFQTDGPRRVQFDFRRFWTDASTGTVKMCRAVEVIHFDEQDKITAITYKEPPLEPVLSEYPESLRPSAK